MKRMVGVALIGCGTALLYFGWQARESLQDQTLEFFTGNPSDRTMLFLIGGLVAVVLGLGLILWGGKKKSG